MIISWLKSIFFGGKLSGRWSGVYEQHGRTFPIELTLKQRGKKLSGIMTDIDGFYQESLQNMLEELGLSNIEVIRIIDDVRSQFPDPDDGEIEYRTYLPTRALIEGRVDKNKISFTKRYDGMQQIEYVLNDIVIPQSATCALVEYSGTLNSEQISGIWTINPPNESEDTLSGTFKLTRKDTK